MNERNTKQKNIILKVVKNSCTHPTAEEVYAGVAKELPNVSLTTVYRNLNKLAEQGIIKRLLIPNQPDRFEKNPTKHYHVCCEICGAFEDLIKPCYNLNLDEKECLESGFFIKSHEIIFKGLCPNCRKNNK
ncbi:MAG: hypothetical protein A2Y15_07985 [Clostridiales bacterium GWF2_36_10]|nr:MAG: hypothetical protein A2Y15_07985 [Clostridiales bacterium GWF2_36_10]HAN20368.1 transcriptional repressor [Clostridiales bacterium]